ncbi:hypothetical protein DPMN_085591 [Dreissena polymorpha]|uniref:Uncharacterized protein n=1 Tax=Dreissena polymorpha TaxID=45954 RepID=A0A9D3YCZ7_DREPO|nr:hypothetical protein DPMN_085591 [Dreissena polymorpha]
MDTTCITSEHRPPNNIAPVGVKSQTVISPHQPLQPFFIFKGKRFNYALMNGASADAYCTMSKTACIADIRRT